MKHTIKTAFIGALLLTTQSYATQTDTAQFNVEQATKEMTNQLMVSHFNAGKDAIFPTTSVMVSGEKEMVLFDAQFSTTDGKALVKMIQESGKTLSMIYVSSGDPDFYFGLEPLVAAFPEAKVLASQSVVEHIEQTQEGKLAYWGPILKQGAPKSIIIPEVFHGNEIVIEGKRIELKEANTHQAYLWLPSQKTIFGGVSLTSGMHVWTADTQTKKSRQEWVESLERMKELEPTRVIPGHYLGDIHDGVGAIQFTIDYLTEFEESLKDVQKNASLELINSMKKAYPKLEGDADLELSAKVNTGEMEW